MRHGGDEDELDQVVSAEHGWRGTKAVAKLLRAAQSGSELEKIGLAPEPEPFHQLSCWSRAVSGPSRAMTTLVSIRQKNTKYKWTYLHNGVTAS